MRGDCVDVLLQKLNNSFDRLQELQIKPTLGNMEILVATMYDLKDVYTALKEMESKNNGEQKDS